MDAGASFHRLLGGWAFMRNLVARMCYRDRDNVLLIFCPGYSIGLEQRISVF